MKCIYTNKGADPQAPYSQAMVTGNLVFTAGQIGLLPGGTQPAGDTVTEQAEQACKNIQNILEAAGTSCKNVVKPLFFSKTLHTLMNSIQYIISISLIIRLAPAWLS